MKETIKSFCHVCPSHCARKFELEDGKIVSVDRDTESGFPSEWCSFTRARIIPEVNQHPDRLKYPLLRVGEKGEGKWKRISCDDALDLMAEKLSMYKEQFGAESFAFALGEPKGMETAYAHRFASYFGTPNVATPGNY